MMAGEVRRLQAMANFGIATEGAGAAAWDVGEDQVVSRNEVNIGGKLGCVGLHQMDPVDEGWILRFCLRNSLAKGCESRGIQLAGSDASLRIAFGEDECLAAGGCAAIENTGAMTGQLRNKLGAFVLEANSSAFECCGSGHVSGDDATGRGEERARFEANSLLCQFGFLLL